MKKKLFLLLLVMAVAVFGAVCAAQAAEPADYNGIYAEAAKMTQDGVFASGGAVEANCPYCSKTVTWNPLPRITTTKEKEYDTDGHYYLPSDMSNSSFYAFYANGCLHLNGHDITSSARAIYVHTGFNFTIMGDGTVTGKGLSNSTCDRGAVDSCGNLTLCGGTYKHTGAYPTLVSRSTKGGINVYDGTLVEGTSGISGSNLHIYNSYLNVYGGVIRGGIANQGGNIYGAKGAKVTIAGGTVTDGTVYMSDVSTSLTLTGAPKVDVINNFDGPQITVGDLTQGADIQVVGQGAITKATTDTGALDYFRSPNEMVKLSVKDGALYAEVDTTADSTAPLTDGKTLKILCLTSSFGLNTTELLYDIAVAEGFEDVIVARLYASGCTLQKHVDGYNSNSGIYWYTKFTKDGKYELDDAKMLDGLLDEDWDIIYIQQGAEQTGQLKTYMDYLDQLMEIVHANKTNPNAKFIWNMTWAFQSDNTRKIFTDTFKGDQLLMHAAIIDAMQEKILTRSDFVALIPTGAAVQNARSSYFGDRLTKDTLHLNNLGRVVAGYALYATLVDKDLTEVNVGLVKSYDLTTPIRLSETDRKVVMEAVNAARANPFEVIQSKYTPEYLNGIGAKAAALSFSTGNATTAECPYCEKTVVWQPLSNSSINQLVPTEDNWGHYYLAEDLTYSDKYLYVDTAELHAGYCLHLNGHSIRNTGKRALWVGAGNTMNIMGSGTITGVGEGSTTSDYRAASLDVNGHVNLFGGTLIPGASRPAVILRTSATRVNLFDGATIQGNASYSASLVNPRIQGAAFNMYGGIVEGGSAVTGGNIYISAKADFNMFGGIVRNGYATQFGGNVYAANGNVNIYGGSIYGGKTENSSSSYGRGGNVAIYGSSTTSPEFNMYGGLLGSETVTGEAAGYATAGGANLYVYYGTANILGDNAVISGGEGVSYGGNIMVSTSAHVILTRGTIKNGTSKLGGNVYLAGTSSNFTQNGGLVCGGTATTSGGNYYINNGYFTFAGGVSEGGTAPKGSNLHLKTGKASAANYALIHHDATVSATAPVIRGGSVLCENNLTLGTFTTESASFDFTSSVKLTVAEGLVLENAAFNDSQVDMAGNDATISGSGTVICYDSANEDFATFGNLTLTGITLSNPGFSTVNSKNYYALAEGSTYSFHRLEAQIVSVALRPSITGVYYTGKWTCDSTLAKKVSAFGVVVSTNDMPGSNFADDTAPDSIWTTFAGSSFASGIQMTGAMVGGILKDDATDDRIALNGSYAKIPIYAVAYITIDGNTYVGDGVSYSLFDVVSAVDAQIGDHPQHKQTMKDFVAYWKNFGLDDEWNFDFE